jgi:hypothetical protein
VTSAAGSPGRRATFLALPELNVVIFAFLLNFVWEFWQVPFFEGMSSAQHWSTTKFCSLASIGDAAIASVSFWTVAVVAHSRAWVLQPSAVHVAIFTMVGVVITVVAEWVAADMLGWWAYADRMPTVPLLGTGLLPLLQWMILPPLVVWFVQRQLT